MFQQMFLHHHFESIYLYTGVRRGYSNNFLGGTSNLF